MLTTQHRSSVTAAHVETCQESPEEEELVGSTVCASAADTDLTSGLTD